MHDVSFLDDGRARSVLYSGSVSEIIAPYGDPSFGTWYPRDEGDYGMGIYSQSSAVPFDDAPPNATFLPATMHDSRGRPINVPRAIAIYERDGGMLWRHANMSRRARQLVVSGHSTIDNYDYQFSWIFSQDGAIEGEVVLSGIMNTNGAGRMLDTAHADGHTSLGHLVAPNVNAPNHQHFFSYRLDLDVDGTANTVYAAETESRRSGEESQGRAVRDARAATRHRTRRRFGRLILVRAHVARREHASRPIRSASSSATRWSLAQRRRRSRSPARRRSAPAASSRTNCG